MELECSLVETVCQLLRKALAMVGRDVLHLVRVRLKEKGEIYLSFFGAFRVP
jgi:hypothetical protein